MTTLTDLRDRVRAQTQTTIADLGDALIDWWLEQGYERTINAEVFWPFFEQDWTLQLDPDQVSFPLPGDCTAAGIITLWDVDRGGRMEQVAQQWAEDHFMASGAASSVQACYSVWNGKITLWPLAPVSTARTFNLRGYRKPTVWLNAAQEPDCDSRLHLPLVHFAVALAYEQQEDETLNGVYMDRWRQDVELAHAAIMKPHHHRPLVGAGSIDAWRGPWVPFVVMPP